MKLAMRSCARVCVCPYFVTRSHSIVYEIMHFIMHTDSWALITRGLFLLQENASQLKQETNNLKQQLLAEQVRHNKICI